MGGINPRLPAPGRGVCQQFWVLLPLSDGEGAKMGRGPAGALGGGKRCFFSGISLSLPCYKGAMQRLEAGFEFFLGWKG